MVACGIPQEDIARCLGTDGIHSKTLCKHYRDELDTSITRANSVIASRLYAAAERGEPWAVCFWPTVCPIRQSGFALDWR